MSGMKNLTIEDMNRLDVAGISDMEEEIRSRLEAAFESFDPAAQVTVSALDADFLSVKIRSNAAFEGTYYQKAAKILEVLEKNDLDLYNTYMIDIELKRLAD